ncbi:unnamed protein product, partial [Schistosoma turkestanicum]
MSICFNHLKLCEIDCFKQRTPTIVRHKFIFKKKIFQNSSCELNYANRRTPSSSSSSSSLSCSSRGRNKYLIRSFGEFSKKNPNELSCMNTETISSHKKDNGRLSFLAGLKKRRTLVHHRHSSMQYDKENEQDAENDNGEVDLNQIGKENMNAGGLRRNTVCSTIGAFKSIRTRGLMELRKSNKNSANEQTKQLNS